MMEQVIALAVVAAVAIAVWLLLRVRYVKQKISAAEGHCRKLEKAAQQEAERLKKDRLLEARDQILQWRSEAESEVQERRRENARLEEKLSQRQERLEQEEERLRGRNQEFEEWSRTLRERESLIRKQEEEAQELVKKRSLELEEVAGMTSDEAKKALLSTVESNASHEAALVAKRIEDQARENAEKEARKIIAQAIQRCAPEQAVESSVSVVDLPSDDMKGRIIGREGRNIRALEQATGVDLIVDDTPEAIILSAFDPLRREIAKVSIESLLRDGRIHPARIEEVVQKVEDEFDEKLYDEGESIVFELGIHDLPREIVHLLGRLRYRTSYGQNVLYHSREVAYLAGIMARELGADVEVCKRGGLLHDVGKAVDRDMEGTHLQLGVQLARKHGLSEEVIHAIEAHHFDVEFRSVEAVIVQAADALSAARPGARREVLESYVKRLEKLEEIAAGFEGVSKAFALQAGREVRIIVESSKVSDDKAFWLTKEIAKNIERDIQYPGQIKVTVIRETRVVDYAR
ncbi:MAG TPA: ribonuclease Y [Acidobacteriota bacterium]|nr:ribonuclease Y [Acidobacteriota bacterium]